jgi:hypothetical protein
LFFLFEAERIVKRQFEGFFDAGLCHQVLQLVQMFDADSAEIGL